jgi:hypothetical protein
MPEENNKQRKLFPSVRIVESVVIAIGVTLLSGLVGYLVLLPQLNTKMEMKLGQVCETVSEIKTEFRATTEKLFARTTDNKLDNVTQAQQILNLSEKYNELNRKVELSLKHGK